MRALIAAVIFLALFGAAAPGVLQRIVDSRETRAAKLAAGNASLDAGRRDGRGREFRLRAEADGHFYVDADINLRPVRLVVDTGATVVALRQSDAATAGIRVVPADFDTPVATANGSVQAARIELDSVMVEDVEIERVTALVLPDDRLPISLLGGSFLNRLTRFEMRDGTLIFEN